MAIQTKDSMVFRFLWNRNDIENWETCFNFFLFFIFSSLLLYFYPNSQRKWEKGRQQIYLAVEEDRLGNCPLQFKFLHSTELCFIFSIQNCKWKIFFWYYELVFHFTLQIFRIDPSHFMSFILKKNQPVLDRPRKQTTLNYSRKNLPQINQKEMDLAK